MNPVNDKTKTRTKPKNKADLYKLSNPHKERSPDLLDEGFEQEIWQTEKKKDRSNKRKR